ncbi:MAG: T9SS type A sorting domain-containing protein [Bacteroidetes bacterium]|nr:T9SS type A sorting domain-containing protein [Bacteroidota bacterium]
MFEHNVQNWEIVEEKGVIYKSTDYGESWSKIQNTGINSNALIYSMAIDPNDPTVLYVATEYGVYKSADAGNTWQSKITGLPHLDTRNIIIDPANSNILYVGIESYNEFYDENWTSVQGGIYKTSDGGQNWIRIDTNPPQPSVSDLAINPTNPDIIYSATREMYDHSQQIMYRGGVYKSTDGGNNWIERSNGFGDIENLNVGSLAINPQNPEIIYAGTFDRFYHDESSGRGVFKSTNGGVTWTQMNTGLSHLSTNIITIDPSDHSRLYVGTDGNGAFTGIDDALINIDDQYETKSQIPKKAYIEQNYPNPFNSSTVINYQLPEQSFVKITIHDITGRLVETLVNDRKDVGYYSIKWNAENVDSGIYFYRIDAEGFSSIKKCVVVK